MHFKDNGMDKEGDSLGDRFERTLKRAADRLLKREIDETVWISVMQFIKFGIVGLSNTVIGYIIYAVVLMALRAWDLFPRSDIYIAQLMMFLLSVLWAFYWNNKAVFKKKEDESRNLILVLLKTYAAYAFTSLFLSEFLLHLWVNVLGISEYVAPIINLVITVPLNFLIQKFWAFRSAKEVKLDERKMDKHR